MAFKFGILVTVCVMAAGLGNLAISADQAESPRNVVVILADDLGYGDLACYGHPQFKTPHLDQMAREGARLTQFYAACPFCAPTRASLLTGRYPFRHGLCGNPHPADDYGAQTRRGAGDDLGISDSEVLLSELFLTAGYRTAMVGKWHLGHKPQFLPVRHGFQEYLGILYSNDMHPVELFRQHERIEFPVDQRTLTKRYTETALEFIRDNSSRPFFLYFAQAMPHKPLAASENFYRKSGAGLYGDAVAELDWSVGQVLSELRRMKLDRRTLVLFTSDNGPWFGGSSGGLRGMKSQCWEGGIRVPMMAWLPGQIPAGHVSSEPAIIMDLFATSLNYAGIKLPSDRTIDGKDIWPLLTSDTKSPHAGLLAVQNEVRTVRNREWKLHLKSTPAPGMEDWTDDWKDPRAPNGTTILAQSKQYPPSAFPGVKTGDRSNKPVLFHLATDPSEQHDVAPQHPAIVAELEQLANKLMQ